MMEFSSGIIIYRQTLRDRLYLLLHYHYKGDYWDFPRGNIRTGETTKQAAIREINEETGLSKEKLQFVEGFEETARWFYQLNGQKVKKKVTLFLAETKEEEIRISKEHIGLKWLNFQDSLRLLKFTNSKNLLLKADNFLRNLIE